MLVADDTCQESFKRRIVFYMIECIVIDANSQAVLSEFQIYYNTRCRCSTGADRSVTMSFLRVGTNVYKVWLWLVVVSRLIQMKKPSWSSFKQHEELYDKTNDKFKDKQKKERL